MKVVLSPNIINIAQLCQSLKAKGKTLLQAETSAHNQAVGFAVGTFISLLPTPGFNFALALLLASWFRQIHRATLLASLAVWNVFVTAPLFALSYRLGNYLFPAPTSTSVAAQWQTQLVSFVQGFFVGNLIIAVGITAVSYTLVLSLTRIYQQKHSS